MLLTQIETHTRQKIERVSSGLMNVIFKITSNIYSDLQSEIYVLNVARRHLPLLCRIFEIYYTYDYTENVCLTIKQLGLNNNE